MTFNYSNVQHCIKCGKKQTRKVIIRRNKGYKSICNYKNGRKCNTRKKPLKKVEIEMIKTGKFIPGLFSNLIK
jgi:hypothetical protein